MEGLKPVWVQENFFVKPLDKNNSEGLVEKIKSERSNYS